MTRDPLDDLLDRSTPTTRPAAAPDLEAMIAEARTQAGPRRTSRVMVAGGAIAVLLVAGVGTAAATDGFSWAPWAQNPVGTVPFTMNNRFDCELRFSEITGGADPIYVAQVNAALRDWYATADVLDAVEGLLPDARTEVAEQEPILQEGETVEDLPPGEWEHREWVREWIAWDQAVAEAETQELARRGFAPGDARLMSSERSGQIQCRDLNGELYVPGADS